MKYRGSSLNADSFYAEFAHRGFSYGFKSSYNAAYNSSNAVFPVQISFFKKCICCKTYNHVQFDSIVIDSLKWGAFKNHVDKIRWVGRQPNVQVT